MFLISRKHAEHLMAIVSGYSNLEYDLEAGARGERYSHFEKLLCRITGAEAAMAVNNNAAAVLLILSALTAGGEVITSRPKGARSTRQPLPKSSMTGMLRERPSSAKAAGDTLSVKPTMR